MGCWEEPEARSGMGALFGGAQGSAGGEDPRDFTHLDGLCGRLGRLPLAALSSPSTDNRFKPLSVCCRDAEVAEAKDASLVAMG